MCIRKETTTPIPPAATGGEQSSMHKFNLSIAKKSAYFKYRETKRLGIKCALSVTLASIGVVTPQFQILRIWQGLRPLYPVFTDGGVYA